MKYFLLLILCAGCSTTELVTPSGARYISKRPPFVKLDIAKVVITKDGDDYLFEMEGMSHDMTGYERVANHAIDAAMSAIKPTP